MYYSDDFKKGLNFTESKYFQKAIECYGKAANDCQTEVAWINKAINYLFLNEPSEILVCADEALKIHFNPVMLLFVNQMHIFCLMIINRQLMCVMKVWLSIMRISIYGLIRL